MRFTRAIATATAFTALALAVTASAASAAADDDILLSSGNVSFGNSFGASAPTAPGKLVWNDVGNLTTPRLQNGNIYIEDSTERARMVIEHYEDNSHDNLIATRYGGEKIGTGVFLNTFAIVLGGVNSNASHVHVILQQRDGPNDDWAPVASVAKDV